MGLGDSLWPGHLPTYYFLLGSEANKCANVSINSTSSGFKSSQQLASRPSMTFASISPFADTAAFLLVIDPRLLPQTADRSSCEPRTGL